MAGDQRPLNNPYKKNPLITPLYSKANEGEANPAPPVPTYIITENNDYIIAEDGAFIVEE